MTRFISVLVVALAILCCSFAVFAENVEINAIPVDSTQDGLYVLTTNNFNHGLVLVNTLTGRNTVITEGRNAGCYATISPDQKYVCYKSFMEQGDSFLQASMVYDIASGQNIQLSEWNSLVGTPAVALDGTMAYTVGGELVVLNAGRQVVDNIWIGYHVNLLDFSKDGKKLTFNNDEGQIVVLNLESKNMRVVDGKNTYWGPKFSPKGDKIMAPTVNGYTAIVDEATGEINSIAKGQPLGWVNDETFAYLDKDIDEKEGKVKKSKLVLVNTLNNAKDVLDVHAGDATLALKGQYAAIERNGQIDVVKVKDKQLEMWISKAHVVVAGKDVFKEKSEKGKIKDGDVSTRAIYNGTYSIYLTGMPYIHQVYDTANNFNGHSACGATSALMAIQYYGILAKHPITVSTPTSHTSDYGWYISNVYTYGRTFNIYGLDPNGNSFAGGFGYIIQNNWADTKGHMAEYIGYHGRTSSVDWSPTFTEAKNEINANHPFVVLTSLTSAGHYITCRGFYKSQYSLVFNDPYGNKNSGYMNYSGSLVAYDWPGYNNGYANMNTVHCFIYAK